jgi:imidazolonepropionase-like amidohydrolase
VVTRARFERATSDAAAALELVGEIGELRQGLCADLLLVDGDPLHDLAALCRPVGVVARGAFDRRR